VLTQCFLHFASDSLIDPPAWLSVGKPSIHSKRRRSSERCNWRRERSSPRSLVAWQLIKLSHSATLV